MNKEFLFLFNTNIAQGFIITLISGLYAADRRVLRGGLISAAEFGLEACKWKLQTGKATGY